MTINKGTLVPSTIRTIDSNNTYPVTINNENKGGLHTYDSLTKRNNIPFERRDWGMVCIISNDGANDGFYFLKYNNVSTDVNDNNNWVKFNPDTFETITIAQALDLMANDLIIPNKLYTITGADTSLYGGTTIYVKGMQSNLLDSRGFAKFFNPKYDQEVVGYGIYDSTATYGIGDSVIWGGYKWTNNNGTVGSALDIFDLSPTSWTKVPFDDINYNVVYNEIFFDWNNLIITERAENDNKVTTSFENIQYWDSIFGNKYKNPINIFQWGNYFNSTSKIGIGNVKVNNSYYETLNFKGKYLYNIDMNTNSWQKDLIFGEDAFQNSISMYMGSYQRYITIKNASLQQYLTLDGGSYQTNITLDNSSYQFNLIFENASYQDNILINGQSYQERLTFSNLSYQSNITISGFSYQIDMNINTKSYQNSIILGTSSYQSSIYYDVNSSQTNLQIYNTKAQNNIYMLNTSLNRASYSLTASEINSKYIGNTTYVQNPDNILVADANGKLFKLDYSSNNPNRPINITYDGLTGSSQFYLGGTYSINLPNIIPSSSIGSSFSVPTINYDSKGRITSVTSSSISNLYFNNSTGIYTTISIATASQTTINISAFKGIIVDDTNDVPNITNVSFSGQTNIGIPNLGSALATYILINKSGNLVFQNTYPTTSQRRQNIFLVKVGHGNYTSITAIIPQPDFINAPIGQLRDMFQPIQYINDGVFVTPNTDLSLNITQGNIHGLGINYVNDVNTPNEFSVNAQNNISFRYRTQLGGTSGFVSNIDPTVYDNNGVITNIVGNNKQSTNQRIFYVPNAGIVIQYGQKVYNTLTEAVAGLRTETFTVYSNLTDNAILIGILSVSMDCTDLSNTSKALFLYVDKFGQTVGSAGGLSTTTLQQAYNNSAQPIITVNSTTGTFSLKNGNGSNNTNLLSIIDNNNNTQAYMVADGSIVAKTASFTNVLVNNNQVIINNGNTIGSTVSIGSNDNNALTLETNGIDRLIVSNTGSVILTASHSVSASYSVATKQYVDALLLGGASILQGGNSFGTTISIGSNDNNDISLKTNNIERLNISNNNLNLTNINQMNIRGNSFSIVNTDNTTYSYIVSNRNIYTLQTATSSVATHTFDTHSSATTQIIWQANTFNRSSFLRFRNDNVLEFNGALLFSPANSTGGITFDVGLFRFINIGNLRAGGINTSRGNRTVYNLLNDDFVIGSSGMTTSNARLDVRTNNIFSTQSTLVTNNGQINTFQVFNNGDVNIGYGKIIFGNQGAFISSAANGAANLSGRGFLMSTSMGSQVGSMFTINGSSTINAVGLDVKPISSGFSNTINNIGINVAPRAGFASNETVGNVTGILITPQFSAGSFGTFTGIDVNSVISGITHSHILLRQNNNIHFKVDTVGNAFLSASHSVSSTYSIATKEYVDSVAGGGTASLPDIITAGSIGSLYTIPSITYDTKGRITNTTAISTTNSYFINGGNTFSGTFSGVIGNNNSGLILRSSNRNILFIENDVVEVRRASYQSYPISVNDTATFRAQNIYSTIDDSFSSRIALGYYLSDYNSHAVIIESNGNYLNIGGTAPSTSLSNYNTNTTPISIDYTSGVINTNFAISTYRKSILFTNTGTTEIERTDNVNNPVFFDKTLINYLIICSASTTQTLKINGNGGTGFKTITTDSEYQVCRTGSGTVQFLADTGTTIYSKSNYLKVDLNGVATVKYLGNKTYLIWGDLIA